MKLNKAAETFQITTPLRVLHWLAQIGHESSFKPQEENLNYSAKRLFEVFPSKFPNIAAAQVYAYKPQAIGSRVYADKLGNGSELSGEGYLYRGRGYLQLTGKSNYTKYGKLIGFELHTHPDLCLQHGISALVAGAYFQHNNILQYADKDDIATVTRLVNGRAMLGLSDRIRRLAAGKKYL
ncbi:MULTISPECIES: glycoside hydrolase family 19 protein [Deinococcus]|uniref:Glycoside hydrolase family 19 protein n=1 Tax=Deinococcus rufus TaxID=2136097 RepID=A0ABV7Z7S9_9DEIO|nr:hypothetical protein [Deinococcus sp. AB2017081]WQE94438.1 hypothetical protein U2P90_13615 [Deinococcus sp. AB2017081]